MVEKEIKETKKGGSNVALIISLLVILCLVGYICYDKVLATSNETNTSTSNEAKKSNSTISKSENCDCDCEQTETANDATDSNKKYCDGEYYVEFHEEKNGLVLDVKNTYYLKNDGTFTADFGGISGSQGVYVITDNTITFIGTKEIVGPRDQDPYYTSSSYVIADDCSYFIKNNSKVIRK